MDIAREIYANRGGDFVQDLGFCHRHGYVVSTPERFIMFRPVMSKYPELLCPEEKADGWYVYLAVGKNALGWFLKQVVSSLSRPLPFILWCRDFKNPGDRVHIWPTEKLISKLG